MRLPRACKSNYARHTSAIRLIPFASRSIGAPKMHMPATHPHSSCATAPSLTSTKCEIKISVRNIMQRTHTRSCFAHTPRIRNPKEFPPHQVYTRTKLQCEQTFTGATQTGTNMKNKHACMHEQLFVLHIL